MCWVYLLYEKYEVATLFENFYTMISMQYDYKIQFLRIDNGTEYFNETLNKFLLKKACYIKVLVLTLRNKMG